MRGVAVLTWLVLAGVAVLPASAAFPGKNGRIVFASNRRADLQFQVFAVPAGGGVPRNVSRRPAFVNTSPAEDTNGEIVFASAPSLGDTEPSILAVAPSGAPRRLVSGSMPILSPDGTRVLYLGPHDTGLFVVPVRGGTPRRLADWEPSMAWSPDSARILLADANGLTLVRADGSDRRTLGPRVPTYMTSSPWSPDGRDLVVEHPLGSDAPESVISVVDVETGSATAVGNGRQPVWSPDGTRIAFVHGVRVATIRPDGSDLEDVTAPPPGSFESSPAWAPDGSRIAFVRSLERFDLTSALGVVDSSKETHFVTPMSGHIVDGFAWARDGRALYYSSRSTRDVFHLFTVGPDLHGVRQLTRGPSNDRQPVWAPDGRRVAFVRDGESLMVLDRNRARVVAGAPGLASPTWSPDGRLAYAADAAIWVIDPKRPGPRGLVSGSEPAWSPDGGSIAYVHDGIRLVRPDGTGDHWLRADEDDLVFTSPAWSPRGDVLYFLVTGRCVEGYLWCGAGGTVVAMRPFTQPPSEVRLPLFEGDKPAVSPDGRFFVFGGGAGLARAPISGSGTSFGEASYATELEPDWQRVRVQPKRRSSRTGSG